MDKKVLRQTMIEKRRNLPKEKRMEKSKIIQDNLFNFKPFKRSNFIFTFISTDEEINTHNIIKKSIIAGKRIGVPITVPKEKKMIVSELKDFDKELELGFYDILTPQNKYIREVSPNIIDVVLVPGLIFTKDGYRIGYGGGYYDRFLNKTTDVVKIGLCFEMQLSETIPISTYDIPVDYIITEERIIDCKQFR
ncbi:5-formyltetrahydrofolate cyclo-ligase [Schnuerera sp. xch1]|uniref:5-formyltetrahydrofolate cyclo-ligase n=1 Tax=Schnuerera sp. xch1 TaxID=2874283 RepID=UPI001CC0772C|nr:5-formyltetrahydrofolate cyclo-ligase [Schnuerera sp. xch1]MBZ2175933.1 5-formyltetrahydrofolate cyclo-ligase [Schnuerera sp. xch1]